ncbi:hypothetical protein TNCV_2048421 [Trichonephila clavipes]|nr:hypothetical protein TNCV_2048421 [Trichonephila clavipes]
MPRHVATTIKIRGGATRYWVRTFGDGPREPWSSDVDDTELAPHQPHQREDVSAFNVHRCPTRRVFSGTGLEPVTKSHGPIPIPLGYRGHLLI